MDEAEATAFIDYLNRQMLAAFRLMPPQLGPAPPPCPVCGLGKYACAMTFNRHRDDETAAREFLAAHPLRPGRDNRRMGFAQVIRCDGGCGAQADVNGGSTVTAPEGWRVQSVSQPGILGPLCARTLTVCPECWPTKTLAEVLGG